MGNGIVRTIQLNGEETMEFLNTLFRPTEEQVEAHNKILEKIDKEVIIRRTQEGLEVDIEGLDLSFLEDYCEMPSVNITIDTKAKEFYYTDGFVEEINTAIVVRNIDTYARLSYDEICDLGFAA